MKKMMKWCKVLMLSMMLAFTVAEVGPVNTAQAANGITAAMTQSSNDALAATNAASKYLYIFALIAFLIGIACFLPGIRQPGWGASAIVVALVSLSAPSCINTFAGNGPAQLGQAAAPAGQVGN